MCFGRVIGVGSTPGTEIAAWYSMMDRMVSGFLEEAMMVFTPASVAISAAISFVSIPPVPRLDPSVAVLTVIAQVDGVHVFPYREPREYGREAPGRRRRSRCLGPR